MTQVITTNSQATGCKLGHSRTGWWTPRICVRMGDSFEVEITLRRDGDLVGEGSADGKTLLEAFANTLRVVTRRKWAQMSWELRAHQTLQLDDEATRWRATATLRLETGAKAAEFEGHGKTELDAVEQLFMSALDSLRV